MVCEHGRNIIRLVLVHVGCYLEYSTIVGVFLHGWIILVTTMAATTVVVAVIVVEVK